MTHRVTLGVMIGAGIAAIRRYTGVLLAVFIAQSIVAVAALLAMAVVLTSAFSHQPLWDDAVDGDFVALVACLRFASSNVLACVGIAFGAALLWALASWFVIGGMYGVFAHRPEGRDETARCFGASGAATYLAYARLAVWSLPFWSSVGLVFAGCLHAAMPRIEHALTVADLAVALAIAVLPALSLGHVLTTVADYTRADISLRYDTDRRSVLATYASSFVFVARHPLTLLHSGVGWIGVGIVTASYSYLAADHPMFGSDGAVALFVIRQGVALARMAMRFGLLAGQLELATARLQPPAATTLPD